MTLPRRIVVFCLPGIGDAILFTPALRGLRRAFPDARITVVTMFRGTADVLETNCDLDEVRHVHFFDSTAGERLRIVRALRRERFDLSILGFPANRAGYNLVNALVGRRWRAGHRYLHHGWRNLWRLNNVVVRETGTRHNLAENLDLVRAICRRVGVPVPELDDRLEVRLTADDEAHAATFLAGRGLDGHEVIGFHAYSSTFKNMARKCWDKDNFVRLIRRLGDVHPETRFVLFSGPCDGEVNDHIVRQTDGRVVVVEQPNLRSALAVLRRCRLVVSNDSGIMHLAGALGVPVVALFGPTDPRRLHPREAPHAIVRQALPCMPCFFYSSRPLACDAGLDYACMRELSVDDVFAAVESLRAATEARVAVADRR